MLLCNTTALASCPMHRVQHSSAVDTNRITNLITLRTTFSGSHSSVAHYSDFAMPPRLAVAGGYTTSRGDRPLYN
eukprot:gene6420-biopygen5017